MLEAGKVEVEEGVKQLVQPVFTSNCRGEAPRHAGKKHTGCQSDASVQSVRPLSQFSGRSLSGRADVFENTTGCAVRSPPPGGADPFHDYLCYLKKFSKEQSEKITYFHVF